MTDAPRNVQISMHKIPVGSGLGAAVLIAVILVVCSSTCLAFVQQPYGDSAWGCSSRSS